jgi:hypothetical protein
VWLTCICCNLPMASLLISESLLSTVWKWKPPAASCRQDRNHMAWAACVRVRGYSSQCFHTCSFVARPSPQDFWGCDLRLTWIKVRKSCAASSSLSCSESPGTTGRQSVKMAWDETECSRWPSVKFVTPSPKHPTVLCCHRLSLRWVTSLWFLLCTVYWFETFVPRCSSGGLEFGVFLPLDGMPTKAQCSAIYPRQLFNP